MDQAVDAFQAGSQSFRNVLDQVASALQAERDSLQAERDTFAEEQHRFAEETARVQQVSYTVTQQSRCTQYVTGNIAPAHLEGRGPSDNADLLICADLRCPATPKHTC